MKVLLVSDEAAGLRLLRALSQSSHEITAVVTSPPGSGHRAGSVWDVAQRLGFQVWSSCRLHHQEFPDFVRSERVDVLLNVHSLSIIPNAVLGAPRLGCFNLHPGPLPRYAGLNSVSWAIYRGEQGHGVTLHQMTERLDAGGIAAQELFPIRENDTALAVFSRCVENGLRLVLHFLDVAADAGALPELRPQNLAERSYFGRKIPNDGWISWEQRAADIFNFVRACDYGPYPSPWRHPRTLLEGQEIQILKASISGEACNCEPGLVTHRPSSEVWIACGDQWLTVTAVLADGKLTRPADVLPAGARFGKPPDSSPAHPPEAFEQTAVSL